MIVSNNLNRLDFRLSQGDGAFNVPGDWHPYTNACWAANWHRLFAGDAGDARRAMGWPDRFRDALSNASEVYNYYSTGDSVFIEQDDVPAVSTAMGGTAMAANNLEGLDLNLPSEGREYKNGWGRDASLFGNDWQHSDMKDMAYFRLPREFSCRGRVNLRELLHCLILSADRGVMKTSVLSQATP